MSYHSTIKFEPAIMLEKGDMVWIRQDYYRNFEMPESAALAKLIKIYDDGNVIYKKAGYDFSEFAWAKDVIAKSPSKPPSLSFNRMSYCTVPITDILEAIMKFRLAQKEKVV